MKNNLTIEEFYKKQAAAMRMRTANIPMTKCLRKKY